VCFLLFYFIYFFFFAIRKEEVGGGVEGKAEDSGIVVNAEPLQLGLEEAFYLFHDLKCLKIASEDGVELCFFFFCFVFFCFVFFCV